MFDPDVDIDGKSGKRSVGSSGGKRYKPQESLEQEYEEGIEGVWDDSSSSSSSSSTPFVTPTSTNFGLGKRSFHQAFDRNSWDDWMGRPRQRDIDTLASLASVPRVISHQPKTIYGAPAGQIVTINNPVRLLINGISAGSTVYERTGRQLHLQSIQLKIYVHPVDDGIPSRTDVYVFYDKQTNGALAAVTDFMEGVSSMEMTRFDNRHRFETLIHRVYSTSPFSSTTGTGASTGCVDDVFKKLNGRIVQYMGDDALVASIASGALILYICGVSTQGDLVEFNYRIVYTE